MNGAEQCATFQAPSPCCWGDSSILSTYVCFIPFESHIVQSGLRQLYRSKFTPPFVLCTGFFLQSEFRVVSEWGKLSSGVVMLCFLWTVCAILG